MPSHAAPRKVYQRKTTYEKVVDFADYLFTYHPRACGVFSGICLGASTLALIWSITLLWKEVALWL